MEVPVPAVVLSRDAERVAGDDVEETQWIERARAGDECAYRWILDRYRERVIRLATHILRQPDEAEDAAQEAFIRAFRKLDGFREDGRFSAWLFRITTRICLDRRRRRTWWADETGAPAAARLERATRDCSEAVVTELVVAALLDRLSPGVRAVLVLRELEGLEYSEIAAALGVPIGTVRSRLNSARSQFRILWLEAMREEENA